MSLSGKRAKASRLGLFISDMTRLVSQSNNDEAIVLKKGSRLLSELVANDDWLPDDYCQAIPDHYAQYLLFCDPLERFSVVSFVWGPGQSTPIHNHTVWGLVGILRGAEISKRFEPGQPMIEKSEERLEPGMVDAVSPSVGDIHKVYNALPERPSVSVHVYGANIGIVSRQIFNPRTGEAKPFVSGYVNQRLPNPWAGVNI